MSCTRMTFAPVRWQQRSNCSFNQYESRRTHEGRVVKLTLENSGA